MYMGELMMHVMYMGKHGGIARWRTVRGHIRQSRGRREKENWKRCFYISMCPCACFLVGTQGNDASIATYDKHINVLLVCPWQVQLHSTGSFAFCTFYLEDKIVNIPHFHADWQVFLAQLYGRELSDHDRANSLAATTGRTKVQFRFSDNLWVMITCSIWQ